MILTIIPYYNAHKTIYDTLYSIQNQKLLPKLIIIINDGSNEKSRNKLNEILIDFSNISIIVDDLQNNIGLGAVRLYAMKKYINHYKVSHLHMIDSDDVIHPEFYQFCSKINFMSNSIVNFNYDSFEKIENLDFEIEPSDYNYKLKENRIPFLQGSLSRNILLIKDLKSINFNRIKEYRTSYEDWIFHSILFSQKFNFLSSKSKLIGYRRVLSYGSSISNRFVGIKTLNKVASLSSYHSGISFLITWLIIIIVELNKTKYFINGFFKN